VWLVFGIVTAVSKQKQKQLRVYALPKYTVVEYVVGKKHWLWTSPELKEDAFVQEYYLQKDWLRMGLEKPVYLIDSVVVNAGVFQQNDNRMLFYGKKILIWNRAAKLPEMQNGPVELDYLIISSDPFVPMRDLLRCYQVKKVIVDASNNYKTAKFVEYSCKKYGVDCVNLRKEKAYVEDL